MKTCTYCARFAVPPRVAVFSSFAQTLAMPQLSETFVSATRTPARPDDLLSDVVVDRAEIEKSAGRTLPEILARVPGLQFSANGGLGKSSSINICGAEVRHTVLLIGGVRYGSATTGTPAWDNTPVDMIERIEIVKDPASARYGSDSVGGAAQIFLRKGVQGQLSLQNDIDTRFRVLLAGIEQLKQKVNSTTAYTVNARQVSSYFVDLNGSHDAHSWRANLRSDQNSQFGNNSTGFAGCGYSIKPAWRVKASYGTSFVAPSFNQLYFTRIGNTALHPESGRNTNLDLTWNEAGRSVKLVRYDNKIHGFIASTTTAVNVPQPRINGLTLAYDGRSGPLTLRASADALDPRNHVTGKRLPWCSASQLRLGADYGVGAWAFGGSLLRTCGSFNDTADLYA